MNEKIKSLIFDFFQVGSILYILLTGPIVTSSVIFLILQITAIVIISEAAWEMRRTKYYRVPDVGKQNELVKSGIYKYIRNPMYFSELLFCGVLLANLFTLDRLVVFCIFFINFIIKIQYEETLLNKYFKDFAKYKKSSKRLVPFIY